MIKKFPQYGKKLMKKVSIKPSWMTRALVGKSLTGVSLCMVLLLGACQLNQQAEQDVLKITLPSTTNDQQALPPFGPDVEGEGQKVTAPEKVVEETTQIEDVAIAEEVEIAEESKVTEQVDGLLPIETEEEIDPIDIGKTRIALLLPLTSGEAGLRQTAEILKDASLLALFDQRNPTIKLVPYDTEGTMQGTAKATERAITDGANVILGPLLSTNVEVAAVLSRQANIPMLTFNNRLDSAGNGVYVLGHSPRFEVETIMEYAMSKGLTRFAVLVPDDEYGEIILESARDTAELTGGQLTRVAYYNPTATDFTELTRDIAYFDGRREALRSRIEELEARDDEVAKLALVQLRKKETLGGVSYEAILLPALDQFTLRTLTAQLSQHEIDQPTVRFLGLSAWDDMGNLANEPQLVGAWYASHPDKGWNRFAKHYKNQFGYLPDNIASMGYEAVALSSILAGRDFQPDFSAEKLHFSRGYQGVRGLFRLNRLGFAERVLAIKQIGRKKATTIQAAASNFDIPMN